MRTNKYREAQNQRARELLSAGRGQDEELKEIEVTAQKIVIAKETAESEENVSEVEPTQEDLDRARNYKFPLTMEQEGFPAKIIFKAIKVEGLDVFKETGITKLANTIKKGLDGLSDEKKSVSEENVSEEEAEKIVADSNVKKKEQVSYENNTGGEEYGRVTLPLQMGLKYNDVAKYNRAASLGVIGAAAENAMGGQNPFAGATTASGQLSNVAGALVSQAVAKNIGSLLGAAAGATQGLAGAGLGAIAGANLGEGLGAAVQGATRIASAPNFRTLFENVEMREFAFDFKLIANNREESKAIRDIITFFRQELYPEKIPLGTSGVPLAYKYPNMFEIEVKNRYGQNPGFKIQRCYLQTVSTTFNESTRGMFVDGSFIEAAVSLTFVEVVALDKQKIRAGY